MCDYLLISMAISVLEGEYIYLEVSKKCTVYSLEICFSAAKVNLTNKAVFAGIQWSCLEICSVGGLYLLSLSFLQKP